MSEGRAIGRLLALAGLFLALSSQMAAAAVPLWKLAPVADINQREFAAPDDIARIRMLPAALLVLEEDYFQDNGRIAVPKGTQLIGVRHSTGMACTIFPPKLSAGAAIFALGADRHLCFLDENNDGTFDQYYFRQTDEAGFYNLLESPPGKRKVGTGGKYRAIDPAEMAGNLDWTVRFYGCRVKGARTAPRKVCRIGISLAVDGFSGTSMGSRWMTYGRTFELDLTQGPQPIEFFGVTMLFEQSGAAGIIVTLTQKPAIEPFILI